MARPDPAITYLKDLGYLPVRLPRSDVTPLQIASKNGKDLELLGSLADAMIAGSVPLPPVVFDIQTAGTVNGQRSSRVKLSVGVNILNGILKALTGKSLDASAGYESADTLRFEFTGVTAGKIDIVRLDQFLNRAKIHPDCKHIEELMLDDEVGVITATISSKRFLVTAQDENSFDISLNVPVLQQIAGGELKVNVTNSDKTEIAYEGATPVVFGVQAIQLFFDENGHYTAFDPFNAGEVAVKAIGLPAAGNPKLFTVGGAFVRLAKAQTRAAARR